MKRKRCLLGAGFVLSLASAASAPAAILNGDVVGADFSTAGGVATNYNTFHSAAATTSAINIASGSVIRLTANGASPAGSVVSGVGLSLAPGGPAGTATIAFNNDNNANNWNGTAADPYYTNNADDIVFSSNASTITYTLTGLDNTLRYNVRVYALINGGATTDTISINGSAATSLGSRVSRWNATNLAAAGLVFNNQTTNGSGALSVQLGSTTSNTFANAIVVEAVPEPASAACLVASGAGLLAMRRRTHAR